MRSSSVVLHLFDSLAAVRAFAGDDYQTAVVPAEARALMTDFDQIAKHFDVLATPQTNRKDAQ